MGDKTRNLTFQLVWQRNVAKQLVRFSCVFKGQPLFHDFLRKAELYLFALKNISKMAPRKTETETGVVNWHAQEP